MINYFMKIELEKNEIDFLLQSLKYAKMKYDQSVGKYSSDIKEMHSQEFDPMNKLMFETITQKLKNST